MIVRTEIYDQPGMLLIHKRMLSAQVLLGHCTCLNTAKQNTQTVLNLDNDLERCNALLVRA